jgi:hypothetical protein
MALAVDVLPDITTRAVERICSAGERRDCAHCGENIGFEARKKNRQVIANIYMKQDVLGRWRTLKPGQYGGQWDRVEHFHPGCYDELGQPYGETELLLPDYRRSGKR